MPYVGQTITDVFPTSISVDSATVSGAFTSQGIDDNADATAITIDSNENVGIGTNSPDTKIQIKGSANSDQLTLGGTDNRGLKISTTNEGGQNDSAVIYDAQDTESSGANSTHIFKTGGTERYRIEGTGAHRWQHSSGDPSAFSSSAIGFHLSTSGQFVQATTGNTGYVNRSNYSSGTIYYNIFLTNGSTVGSISYNGSSTSYTTSSDYRLKESVTYDFDATSRLKQLKPSRFNFIGKSETVDGFLAHEVSSIVPEAITGAKDGTEDIGTVKTSDGTVVHTDIPEDKFPLEENQTWTKTGTQPVYQQIDQAKIIPLLTKALQEQQATIEALTARIVTLEKA